MRKLYKEYIIILILPVFMIIYALLTDSILNISKGLMVILKTNNILVTDYFQIAGVSAAFINAAVITIINIAILFKLRLKLNGLLISAIFLMLSFGLMGKTMINILPFYVGGYLHALFNKQNLKNVIYPSMMSTALAPVVSAIPYWGVLIAILVAFIFPFIVKHVVHFHNGYILYNSGLGVGVISILIYSILKNFGIEFDTNKVFYQKFDKSIFILFLLYFLMLIIIGYIKCKDNFKINLYMLYKHTGRLVTDFVQKEGFYISIFNMGLLGIFGLILILIHGKLNAPVIAGLLTLVGFGGIGKHLKNIFPVIIGVIISSYVLNAEVPTTIFVLSLFLSTSLAPIAGKFGIIYGIGVGILYYPMAISIGLIHGGINLYSSALAAGMTVSVYLPLITGIEGGLKKWKNTREK
ncbi:DUF1576 domain-containing protein [Oceanivirga salmonicida]|uniref:DUF1576 domain-containing protein n=1 Tax=Oceanivirga salmonicida TaxID=1769291 RepID=UPI00082E3B8B|nr:DUF1576 domain-containing protein [Oceanivirga salmonicida]